MSDTVTITCGARDDKGRRLVVATLGTMTHRHRFDTDSQFHRKQYREAVVSKFNLEDDAHEFIESQLIAAADASESEPLIQLATVRMNDVAPQSVEWLWRERFAIGKLTLIVGDPGLGKSFLTLDMAARISRGAAWPDNPWEQQPAGDVILLTCEDDLADTIRPRLDAHNADVARIIAIGGAKFTDDDDEAERMVNLATDLDLIRGVAREANNPRAIIIDPVSAYLGKTDSHKNAEVRGLLGPLANLAAELRLAVIAVSHLRKGEGAAMYRTMGSLAFVAQARSAWVVCRDEADSTRRLMLPIKSNIAGDVGGLAFAIQPHGPDGTAVLCWEREPVSVNADDAIGGGQRKRGPEPDERQEVAKWLSSELAGGPRPAKELIEDGDGLGFSKRTIQRAFREIGGRREKRGFSGGWLWALPEGDTKAHEGTRHKQPGTLGQTWHLRENPEEEEEAIKFLSTKSTEDAKFVSGDTFDPFEAEIAELNGQPDVAF